MREKKRKKLIKDFAGSVKADAVEATIRKEIAKIRKEAIDEADDMKEVEGARRAIERLRNVIRRLRPSEEKEEEDNKYDDYR